MHKSFIQIEARRGEATVVMDFPEEDTRWNRMRWFVAGLIAPVKVRWFE